MISQKLKFVHRKSIIKVFAQVLPQNSAPFLSKIELTSFSNVKEPIASNKCWQFTWVGPLDNSSQTQDTTCR